MVKTLMLIMLCHFIGDFIFQTKWMMLNKAKSIYTMLVHVGAYSTVFLVWGAGFTLITGGLHLIVDMISSKFTYYLWNRGAIHWFFVVLGLDQLFHYFSLLVVAKYLNIL